MPKIALIEYFTTEEKTYVFVVRPGDEKPVVLEATITGTRLKECRDRLLGIKTRNESEHSIIKGPGTEIEYFYDLSDELVGKFLPYVDGFDILYLVPHGWLHDFPFHALKCNGGNHLIENFKIVYSPSAGVLKHCQTINRARQNSPAVTNKKTCLALGVGVKDDYRENKKMLEAEAQYVAGEVFGKTGEYRIGLNASKAYFMENCQDKDVIHLACHGVFEPYQPLRSGLLLSDGNRLPDYDLEENGRIRVPDDMLLAAKDFFSLDLKTDLVVLNACVTGVSEKKPGDEMIGLTRALIYAGAPSVIVSLWELESEASRVLIELFYQYWLGSEGSVSKVEALQKAQMEFIHNPKYISMNHPHFWSPFVLVGDWL